MSAMDWLVIGAAAVAIAWVNWYFFLAGAREAAARREERPARDGERDR